MKILIIALFFFTAILHSVAQGRITVDENERVLSLVRNYTDLLTRFSGNQDNILLTDSILAMCENDNIQTFDDLEPSSSGSKMGFKACPILQYLQKITLNYDNKLNIQFSDFKCDKIVIESLGTMSSNTYVLVHVHKKIKGKDISKSEVQKITVNLNKMKIAGTISEQYEDPQAMYFEAIGLQGKSKPADAINLLKKCITYESFSGRYRAMSMIGVCYYAMKSWAEAIEWLTQSAEHDASGAIWLASILSGEDINIPKQYMNKSKAIYLLEKHTNVLDLDAPHVTFSALGLLTHFYASGTVVPKNMDKAWGYMKKMCNFLSENPTYLHAILQMMALVDIYTDKSDFKSSSLIVNMTLHDIDNFNDPSLAMYKTAVEKIKNNISAWTGSGENTVSMTSSGDEFLMYIGRYESEKNFDKMFEYIEKAAEKGTTHGIAEFYMFTYYYPYSENDIKAINGNAYNGQPQNFGQYVVNCMHNVKDKKKAISYLKLAAEKGFPDAMVVLGKIYLTEEEFRDIDKGVDMTIKSLDNISLEQAYGNAATLYMTIQDDKQGKILQKVKAYCDKSGGANFVMSVCYDNLYKDSIKSIEYLEKGAELGFYGCMYNLCIRYRYHKDYEDAMVLADKIISKGYNAGYSLKGEIFEDKGDYSEAVEWYQKGYEVKESEATFELAIMYHDGKGVAKNLNKALQYVALALEYAPTSLYINVEDAQSKQKEWQREADSIRAVTASDSKRVSGISSTASLDGYKELNNELMQVLDVSKTPDVRIGLAEKVMKEFFDSPKAVVKIVGTNGATVVATKTAEEFLLELSTKGKASNIKILDVQKAATSKILNLSVQF